MNILTIKSPAVSEFNPVNNSHHSEKVIHDACLITVCAWCYPRSEQEKLLKWGLSLSHGICADCKNHFLAGNPKTTIKL